ncbi:MAG: tetratricopeptide repeat protein [Enterocloster clostridioformis]
MEKAVELFTQSAEQDNEYAAYQLGKLYLAGEDIPKDVEAAIRWPSFSSDSGNAYAQYALGKVFLAGEDVPKDVRKAVQSVHGIGRTEKRVCGLPAWKTLSGRRGYSEGCGYRHPLAYGSSGSE